MKKLVSVSLFIFWAVVVAILVAGLLFYQKTPRLASTAIVNSSLSSVLNNSVTASGGQLTLNMAEVAKHNSGNDCWMVIANKVYNVTGFLSAHPGGAGTMLPFCGQEATQAYNTKDGRGRPHSGSANAMLADYYVGDLNQAIGQAQVQSSVQKNNKAAPAVGGSRDESD